MGPSHPCLVSLALACLSAWILAVIAVQENANHEEWSACIDVERGTKSYFNPDREACCNGQIFRRTSKLEEICCGERLYDSTTGHCCGDRVWFDDSTHFCCGDEVYPLDEEMQCCEGRAVNTTTHTCCSWNVLQGVGHCCGDNDLYSPLTETCCVGLDGTGYVHTVGREAVVKGTLKCCGTEAIDTEEQLCCQGNPLIRESPSSECCGPEVYDTRNKVCCTTMEGFTELFQVSPLVEGRIECCGLTPYNKDNEQCCESVVTHNIGDGRCCGSVAYNPVQASCCYPGNGVSQSVPEIPGVQDCCDGESYLKTEQVCCSNTLHNLQSGRECCGTDLYDPSTHLCCEGNIVHRPSPTSQCCGSEATYDPEQQTCCFGQVSNVVNGSCCRVRKNLYQAYDPAEKKCCEQPNNRGPTIGKIHGIDATCCGFHALHDNQVCNPCTMKPMQKMSPDADKVCCHILTKGSPRTYNSKTQICRLGRVYTKRIPRPGYGLCSGVQFNLETQLCCHRRIHDKIFVGGQPLDEKCCGTETYFPEHQTCGPDHAIYDVPEISAGFCRGKAFNNETHMCDNHNARIRPITEMEQGLAAVCDSEKADGGYYAYDPSKHECCGDMLIDPGETCCNNQRFLTPGTGLQEGECCGSVGFNPSTHLCCDGELHEITSEGQKCCGRQFFDPSSTADMCCNDTLLSMEDGQSECTDGVAHRPSDTVCDGMVYPVENGQCCGQALMDSKTQICCQGKFLYEKSSHSDTCCGRVVYDSSDESKKCCVDSLFHDAGNLVCCRSQAIDRFTETCDEVGGLSYSFPRGKSIFRCEEGDYDPSRQTCCQGLLYNFPGKCCGNEVIRRSDKNGICCGNRRQENNFGDRAICCGGELFDARTHTCCGDTALPKSRWWETCCDGVVTGRQACQVTKNNRKTRPPSDLQQCGGTPFNNETLICCANKTHNSLTMGCCGGKPYELSKRTCCDSTLYRVKNGACCGTNNDIPYSRNRYLCCSGTLRRMKNGRTECCGNFAVNPNTDTCCDGRVTRGLPNRACCGNKAFDPANKMCCPKTMTLYKRRPSQESIPEDCCAPGMQYDMIVGSCIPQECDLCATHKSIDGWKRYIHKHTIIRGVAVNVTSSPTHHVLHLTRVHHLNHDKRESRADSSELSVRIPLHCGCQQLDLDKAYVIMSDSDVEWGYGFDSLALQSTDFLARARHKLGTKIKRRLCKIKGS